MAARYCSWGNPIPFRATIDGVERQFKNRKRCLSCSPFRGHNNRDLAAVSARIRTAKNEKYRLWQEKARQERKAQLVALLGGRCSVCGYDRCVAALEFHHRDPGAKLFPLGKGRLLKRWDIVVAEARKCDLLCANCHRELEESLRLQAIAALG